MIMLHTLVLLVALAAQTPPQRSPAPAPDEVAVDPVTCWWRTDASAVRVGQTFDVVLTCAFLQTEAARVVADESRLEPAVVQLPPFDVLGGSHAKDVATAGRRFVQYTYQLRLLAENSFSAQIALPALEITYRVESRVSSAESLQGRDLTYLLPPLAIRVLSLVPDTAQDIREAPVATFQDIEGKGSRGTMLRAVGGTLLALAGLMLILTLVNMLRRRRAARPASERVLPPSAVLAGVRRELDAIKAAVLASGWTSDLAGRALAALRIVAAHAAGRPVTQHRVGTIAADGQLLVSGRIGAPTVVSAAVASADDDELRDALTRFAAARYGREERFDARLDDAVDAAIRHVDRLMSSRPWLERVWPR
jgi:hypothetical protein